jgi:hypothetical protein
LVPEAGGGQGVGGAGHAFRPAHQRDVGIAQHQRLRARDHGLQTGPAEAVDVHRGGGFGHACLHGGDTGQVHVARFGVDDMAEDGGADGGPSIPARSMAALAAVVARSMGAMPDSDPPKVPMAVRAPERM